MVRLSGPSARSTIEGLFQPVHAAAWQTHQLRYGLIIDSETKETIDDVMVAWMQAPNTYTGEEVVEIFAHGNPVLLEQIMLLCVAKGARLARAGEFTQRAFLNGRIDLVQAEAVAELIHAESVAETASARRRLSGHVSSELETLYQNMIAILAECEADVDFPDENLPIAERPAMMSVISDTLARAKKLMASYDTNKKLHDGFAVAFVGAPNAGKSSLFNALLREQRAIVTPIAGTTRDSLRESLEVAGRKIHIVDTAGLRIDTADEIEKIGMERSRQILAKADLVCLVVSAEQGWGELEENLMNVLPREKAWLVWNKIDVAKPLIPPAALPHAMFSVSAKAGTGLEEFRKALAEAVVEASPVTESGGIANDRQKNLLQEFLGLFEKGYAAWIAGESPEFVSSDFRQAIGKIGELLGKDDHQERILDEIFSKFCVGK